MTLPTPFGDDLYPNLLKLAKFLEPHVKVLISLRLILYPLSNARTTIFGSQNTIPLLLFLAAYCWGFLKFPEIGSSKKPATNEQSVTTLLLLAVVCLRGNIKFPSDSTTGFSVLFQSELFQSEIAISLLVSAAYIWGFLKLPDIDLNKPGQWAAYVEPYLAFKVVSDRIGIYFKAGIFISLACYLQIFNGAPLFFQPWLYCLLFAVLAIIGFFAPTTSFRGPLRFGYLEHAKYFVQLYSLAVDWWAYAALFIVFAPNILHFVGFGIIAMSVAAWVFVYRQYHEELRKIIDQVTADVSRASVAAALASTYASTAERYEQQLLAAAALARRDWLQATSVKITDFFDCAATAWSALGEVTQPAEDTTKKSADVLDAVSDLEATDKPDGRGGRTANLIRYLKEIAQLALSKSQGAEAQLRAAQEAVLASKEAKQQETTARNQARSNAVNASTAAKNLADKITGSPEKVAAAAKGAENVKIQAEQAIYAATQGEIAQAKKFATTTKTSADSVELSMTAVRNSMNSAHTVLLDWIKVE